VGPTLIDSAGTLAAVTAAIAAAPQLNTGSTNMADGINLLTSLVTGSALFGTGEELFNVSSDGLPNSGGGAAGAQAAAAAAAAAGIDGLSAEGVGPYADLAFLQTIVFPGTPGPIVTPGTIPDPRTQGFVGEVASFADFQMVMEEKILEVTNGVIPEPGPVTLYGLSLLVLYGCRRVLRSGSR
jgi:hypothetical protein